MKTSNRWIALLLAAALLCCLFAACATQEAQPEQTPGDAPAANPDATTPDPADADGEDEELRTINFWLFDLSSFGQDHGARITEAVNRITEDTINTHVNITYVSLGDYLSKVQLAISGGEQIDVLCLCVSNKVTNLQPIGMLMDATDVLNEYAAETLELMRDYIGTYTYDGKIYGVPTLRNYSTNGYILMKRDYLEELNLLEQAEAMDSWSDYEAILDAVNAAYGGTGEYAVTGNMGAILGGAGYMLNGDNFSDIEVYDTLNDTTNCVYVSPDGEIGLRQAQPGYQEGCERVAGWFARGLVYPDSQYTDVDGDALMRQGVAFSELLGAECDIEATKTSVLGFPVFAKQYRSATIQTSTLTSWGIGIPTTAEEPEAAAKFINALYTNADLMNLLMRGEQDVDYTLEDGQAKKIENQYAGQDFICGNNTLLIPLYGNGADYYERVREMNAAAALSPYLGFSLNLTDEMNLQISQITAVTDQYTKALQCGAYTEDMYQEFLSKLEAAGVYDYLLAIGQQLDAWKAAQ